MVKNEVCWRWVSTASHGAKENCQNGHSWKHTWSYAACYTLHIIIFTQIFLLWSILLPQIFCAEIFPAYLSELCNHFGKLQSSASNDDSNLSSLGFHSVEEYTICFSQSLHRTYFGTIHSLLKAMCKKKLFLLKS